MKLSEYAFDIAMCILSVGMLTIIVWALITTRAGDELTPPVTANTGLGLADGEPLKDMTGSCSLALAVNRPPRPGRSRSMRPGTTDVPPLMGLSTTTTGSPAPLTTMHLGRSFTSSPMGVA